MKILRLKKPVLKVEEPLIKFSRGEKLPFPPKKMKTAPVFTHLSGQFNDFNVELNNKKHGLLLTKFKFNNNINGVGARGKFHHNKTKYETQPKTRIHKKFIKEKDNELQYDIMETEKMRDEDGAEVRGEVALNHADGIRALREEIKKVPKGQLEKRGYFSGGWRYNMYEESIIKEKDEYITGKEIYDDEFNDIQGGIEKQKNKYADTKIRPNPQGV